ncbi:tRNA (guanosine(37)-N1)-methyltransferase TrmD [Boudabousia tangfeifanii]|uniref:tRNA (guanine-N(1)-)-methyltransferase n=1 Tax=Boudabousia tangfeifanii TaxID=1912795 RepID=A0A1D9MJM1_9ACTO|nr:tRNA (guanosine(37)-N1)-methyltransferase TrmD [Boudabousia tangfeifanii]AOZ72541.1 tRNA (guanosine(37)-N1)-methyltransferase TrmD [Boudabousia tangfeifanii]
MRFDVITIFPDFFAPLKLSLIGKAQEKGTLDLHVHDLRDWTDDPRRTVDDSPYGGGAGMVMRLDIWAKALQAVAQMSSSAMSDSARPSQLDIPNGASEQGGEDRRILMIPTPSGRRLTQDWAQELAAAKQLVFACGRYEGIDSRFATYAQRQSDFEVQEFSLGDYVLNGGESATMVLIEAVARLVPEVIGNEASLVEESHGNNGLLEYSVFTRPWTFAELEPPAWLKSGDHALVDYWRHREALERTWLRRPDLLAPSGKAFEALTIADEAYLLTLGWPGKTGDWFWLLGEGAVTSVGRRANIDQSPENQWEADLLTTPDKEDSAIALLQVTQVEPMDEASWSVIDNDQEFSSIADLPQDKTKPALSSDDELAILALLDKFRASYGPMAPVDTSAFLALPEGAKLSEVARHAGRVKAASGKQVHACLKALDPKRTGRLKNRVIYKLKFGY